MNLLYRAHQIADGAKTLTEWLGSGAVTVDPWHAQTRADVCLVCPNNVQGGVITKAIAEAIRRQVEVKNKLQLRVAGEKNLHTCSGCGCYLRLKLWLPIANLGLDKSELETYPAPCWMRNEFNNQPHTP